MSPRAMLTSSISTLRMHAAGTAPTASASQPSAAAKGNGGLLGALSSLPAPKTSAASPAAAAVKQQRVFKVPLDTSKLIDSDEEVRN